MSQKSFLENFELRMKIAENEFLENEGFLFNFSVVYTKDYYKKAITKV